MLFSYKHQMSFTLSFIVHTQTHTHFLSQMSASPPPSSCSVLTSSPLLSVTTALYEPETSFEIWVSNRQTASPSGFTSINYTVERCDRSGYLWEGQSADPRWPVVDHLGQLPVVFKPAQTGVFVGVCHLRDDKTNDQSLSPSVTSSTVDLTPRWTRNIWNVFYM